MPHAWEAFKVGFGAAPVRVNKWRARGEAEKQALTDARAALIALDIDDVDDLLDDAQELIDKLQGAMDLYDTGRRKDENKAIKAFRRRVKRAEKLHKKLRAALRQADPADIMAEPGGPQLLDLMMEDINWPKAKTADKDFAIGAIKARFNLPEFTTPRDRTEAKALPRFYRALKIVPESHTLGNDSLLSYVQRARPEEGDGRFSGVYKSTEKRIITHLDQILEGKTYRYGDEEVPKSIRPTGHMRSFAHTTLHEVGHAVDDKHKIMSEDNDALRAGWRHEDGHSTALAIGREHGFFAAFDDFPEDWLIQVLVDYGTTGQVNGPAMELRLTLGRRDAENLPPLAVFMRLRGLLSCEQARLDTDDWPDDPGDLNDRANQAYPYANAAKQELIQAGLDDTPTKRACTLLLQHVTEQVFGYNRPLAEVLRAKHAAMSSYEGLEVEDVPWDELEAHAAAKALLALYNDGYKGSKGYYHAGRAGAETTKVGARTYTVDNNQKWWSYLFAKRNEGVSQYQFNAPAEWFSELYALYHGGKLPDGHPALPLLNLYDA